MPGKIPAQQLKEAWSNVARCNWKRFSADTHLDIDYEANQAACSRYLQRCDVLRAIKIDSLGNAA
jgi:hypothetical protein